MILILIFSVAVGLPCINQGESVNSNDFSYAESVESTSAFLQTLLNQTQNLPITYNLTNDFVIDSENQLSTDFCWIFSSLKCLETSFMLQQNTYYNFSETAMAYLNFINQNSSGQNTFNTTGNMLNLYSTIRQCGLVFEGDVSNDYLLDINESNYNNYSFISDKADKSLSDKINIVSFGENDSFKSLSNYNQIMLMKAFIKNYGALFLAFSEGDGVLYQKSTGVPEYSATSAGHENEVYTTISKHAVCIIGWDSLGFYALNSWGEGNDYYEVFHIAYNELTDKDNGSDINALLETVRGFLVGENEQANLLSGSENSLINIFNYSDKISLIYKMQNNIDFNKSKVKIFKGTEDVTYNFEIKFDNKNYQIEVNEKFNNIVDDFGGFIIEFYEDEKVISKEMFYKISGTEISSIVLEQNLPYNINQLDFSYLNNNYLSNKKSVTFTISPYSSYSLKLNLSGFSKCIFSEDDPNYSNFKTSLGEDKLFEVSTVRVLNVNNNSSSWSDTNLSVNKIIDYSINSFIFELPDFSGDNLIYQNKLLAFDIVFNSTKLNETQSKITIMLFIAETDGSNTKQNLSIYYHLDGGKNSEENITSFPNYLINSDMTNFVLKSPTKSGFEFLGWYSDKNYKHQIFVISKDNLSDMVLYAKWSTADISDYVESSIEVFKIVDLYDNEEKNVLDIITYGDLVTFKFTFSEKAALSGHNFSARLIAYLLVGSQKIFIDTLNEHVLTSGISLAFEIGYPDIGAGNYKIIVETQIVVNNILTLDDSAKYEFVVEKREVDLVAENFEFNYDGEYHFPNVSLKDDDIFANDKDNLSLSYSMSTKKDAGDYNFSIYLNDNNYKFSASAITNYDFSISKKQVNIVWGKSTYVFLGTNQSPLFEIDGLVNGDISTVSLKNANYFDVGEYIAEIDTDTLSNKNYYVEDCSFEFEIIPAKIKIIANDIIDKLSTSPKYRKKLTYDISGDIFDAKSDEFKTEIIDSLNLTISSEGIAAETFGKYDIIVSISNNNFDAEILNGVYKVIAPYKVFYTLPDGSVIEEQVDEGCQPKGLSRDDYDYTIFQSLEYSGSLYGDGTSNIYVYVTVKDYTFYFIIGSVIITFIAVYLIITRKQRHNKVS